MEVVGLSLVKDMTEEAFQLIEDFESVAGVWEEGEDIQPVVDAVEALNGADEALEYVGSASVVEILTSINQWLNVNNFDVNVEHVYLDIDADVREAKRLDAEPVVYETARYVEYGGEDDIHAYAVDRWIIGHIGSVDSFVFPDGMRDAEKVACMTAIYGIIDADIADATAGDMTEAERDVVADAIVAESEDFSVVWAQGRKFTMIGRDADDMGNDEWKLDFTYPIEGGVQPVEILYSESGLISHTGLGHFEEDDKADLEANCLLDWYQDMLNDEVKSSVCEISGKVLTPAYSRTVEAPCIDGLVGVNFVVHSDNPNFTGVGETLDGYAVISTEEYRKLSNT